jgi:hypothetical protein
LKSSDFIFQHWIRFNDFRNRLRHFFCSDVSVINRKWKKVFGAQIRWDNPQTINEKIQWLKINAFKPEMIEMADKYKSRDYFTRNFGPDGLVPLLLATNKASDISAENIKEFPCIIKPNNASGFYDIIRSPKDVNWHHIRRHCRTWLSYNYYADSQEKPYKYMKPMILVEKLLQDENNKIPNDYKLHFFNGKLGFIYCSIDRENKNYRAIYDDKWNRLPFSWVEKGVVEPDVNVGNIQKPTSLQKMIEIGSKIAKDFPYVRVDFYDINGKLYYGEITFYHGSGFDVFVPEKFDFEWGGKCLLSK